MTAMNGGAFRRATAYVGVALSTMILGACESAGITDTSSLLSPTLHRSEVAGLVAGLGTTFAAVPDLIGMLRRRSSKGINPRMAGITGVFQVVWIYYGLLIASRPVVAWNSVGVVINLLTVAAYLKFVQRETHAATSRG